MPKGYHHMTQEIRSEIYALKATGIALIKIGRIVGYDVSAISCEIKRNTDSRGYRYKHANHNHDVHIMAREIDEWLPQGIQSLIDGTYDIRCLKRYCFEDEVVDHVHLLRKILRRYSGAMQIEAPIKSLPQAYDGSIGRKTIKIVTQEITYGADYRFISFFGSTLFSDTARELHQR